MDPQAMTVTAGAMITFVWSGYHTVFEVFEAGHFTGCVQSGNNRAVLSPYSVTLDTPGTYYYICAVGSHCFYGQKIAITVLDRDSGQTDGSPFRPPPPPFLPPPPSLPPSPPNFGLRCNASEAAVPSVAQLLNIAKPLLQPLTPSARMLAGACRMDLGAPVRRC